MRARPVLVIDNDAEAIKVIADNLKPLGYSVITAASGEEGLDAAKTKSPALILINLAVPGTDGLAICKSFISIIDSPIVLLTMRDGKYDARYKTQYGIVDFVKKPVSARDLAYKVDKYATPGGPEEDTMAAIAEEADALEVAEEAEAIEMVEEAPSVAELAATATRYASGGKTRSLDDEEIEAVEVISDDELTDAMEVVEAIPAGDIGEAKAEYAEEEPGEWSIPEEDATEAPGEDESMAWEMSESVPGDSASEEMETPDWSMDEEEEAPSFEDEEPPEEAVSDDVMDLGELDEEQFEESGGFDDEPLSGENVFGDEAPPSRPYVKEEEPFALDDEEPYELPPEDSEYEVRPAALERAKRRKSRSHLLIPFLILLLLCTAAAGAYFFYFAKKGVAPTAKKPAPAVAERAEPAPAPAKTVEKEPPTERKATTSETTAKKPARVVKRPATPKAAPSPSTASSAQNYYVQFGAFRSRENASKFQSQLKELGYETSVKELNVSGQPLYLVLLSTSFTDKWTAFKQARQIKEKSDIGTAVHVE